MIVSPQLSSRSRFLADRGLYSCVFPVSNVARRTISLRLSADWKMEKRHTFRGAAQNITIEIQASTSLDAYDYIQYSDSPNLFIIAKSNRR
jgi:hypothetical protein